MQETGFDLCDFIADPTSDTNCYIFMGMGDQHRPHEEEKKKNFLREEKKENEILKLENGKEEEEKSMENSPGQHRRNRVAKGVVIVSFRCEKNFFFFFFFFYLFLFYLFLFFFVFFFIFFYLILFFFINFYLFFFLTGARPPFKMRKRILNLEQQLFQVTL